MRLDPSLTFVCDFYDKHGNPLTLIGWGQLWVNLTYRICGETLVPLPERVHVLVRTVWNGFADSVVGVRMFSTAYTFDKGGNWAEARVYDTLDDALAGHQGVCADLSLPATAIRTAGSGLPEGRSCSTSDCEGNGFTAVERRQL